MLHQLGARLQEHCQRNDLSCWQKLSLSPLFGLSRLYLSGSKIRAQAYQHGFLSSAKLPCRVICVGNLTVGGTGKTPTVDLVCRTLLARGEKVAIISRGYGKKTSNQKSKNDTLIVSDGRNILTPVTEAGDEPFMLAKRLPGVPVLIGKNRYQSGRKALELFDVNTLVMDDGFQHLQLARDLNIVVLDGRRPFGNGYGLPCGSLREAPEALNRADLLVLTKIESLVRGQDLISSFSKGKPNLPIFLAWHRPTQLISLQSKQTLPVAALSGKNILALSGLGDPSHFQTTLEQQGATVLTHLTYPDHYWYSHHDLSIVEEKARSLKVWGIITTEKDSVRLANLPIHIPVWMLCIDLAFWDGLVRWEKLFG